MHRCHREGAVIVTVGFLAGAFGSWALSRYIRTVLYGVQPLDPVVMGTVSLLLFAVALLASTLPAVRAARVDPIISLREE
jgi:putative ABC transport system permease protein